MPRGFGKTRLELTVKETWRERAAATCGVDQNIEVTKIAAKVLETFADTGSYWSPQDKRQLALLAAHIREIDIKSDALEAQYNSSLKSVSQGWSNAMDEACNRWQKAALAAVDMYENLCQTFHEQVQVRQGLIEDLLGMVDELLNAAKSWKTMAGDLLVVLTAQKLENQRLRALLEEHCKGCPASELK